MIPQAVTLVLHAIGGYLLADVADRLDHPEAGIPASVLVGVAKEATDLNFNFPDAVAWPVGAYMYRLGKEKGWCFTYPESYREEYWYLDTQPKCHSSPR
jgi:hypothetical protein